MMSGILTAHSVLNYGSIMNILLFKKSTNLSFVMPPFSYNFHPIHFELDIATNKVNFLKKELSDVLNIQRFPREQRLYSAIIAVLRFISLVSLYLLTHLDHWL